MSTQTWTVQGMTCEHCVPSVTEEVSDLAGVRTVDVVLVVEVTGVVHGRQCTPPGYRC